jgi:hypothetical protein
LPECGGFVSQAFDACWIDLHCVVSCVAEGVMIGFVLH